MLARIAYNLFWLGRYLERCENAARLLASIDRLSFMPEHPADTRLWRSVLAITDEEESFHSANAAETREAIVRFMTVDRENPSSLVRTLMAVRENARTARDLLCDGYWLACNATYHECTQWTDESLAAGGVPRLLAWAERSVQWIRGAGDDLMRDEVVHVLNAGMYLERADFTARLIHTVLTHMSAAERSGESTPGTAEHRRWEALLMAAGVIESYRRTRPGRRMGKRALHLLVNHPRLTRSLMVCLQQVAGALAACCDNAARPQAIRLARGLADRLGRVALDDRDASEPQLDMGPVIARITSLSDVIQIDHFRMPVSPAC